MPEKEGITLTEARAELTSAQNRIANLFQEREYNPHHSMCVGDYATIKAVNESIGKSLSYLADLEKAMKMLKDKVRLDL